MLHTKTHKKTIKSTKKEMDLNDLLINKLSVLYDIEHELIKALPKLIDASTDEELSEAFTTHLEETKNHVRRLEQVFVMLDTSPSKEMKSAGIRGIIEDGAWVIKNVRPPIALDANLIAAASYAEHYEIAGYMAAKEWARTLGYDEIADLLDENLMEEVLADNKLSHIAKQRINAIATL